MLPLRDVVPTAPSPFAATYDPQNQFIMYQPPQYAMPVPAAEGFSAYLPTMSYPQTVLQYPQVQPKKCDRSDSELGIPVELLKVNNKAKSKLHTLLNILEPPTPKQIGRLTPAERQAKLDRYRQKREHRMWKKTISYSCRKKQAVKRLRYKGRFITKDEAEKRKDEIIEHEAKKTAKKQEQEAVGQSNVAAVPAKSEENIKIFQVSRAINQVTGPNPLSVTIQETQPHNLSSTPKEKPEGK